MTAHDESPTIARLKSVLDTSLSKSQSIFTQEATSLSTGTGSGIPMLYAHEVVSRSQTTPIVGVVNVTRGLEDVQRSTSWGRNQWKSWWIRHLPQTQEVRLERNERFFCPCCARKLCSSILINAHCKHVSSLLCCSVHSSYDVARKTVLLMREICSKTKWSTAKCVCVNR